MEQESWPVEKWPSVGPGVGFPFVAHASDSAEQREAEATILAAVAASVGQPLAPGTLALPGGSQVEVDGVAEDGSILVEVFARQGSMKGGQRRKVAQDALKLVTVAKDRPVRPRLILAFGDEKAAARCLWASWLSEALRIWGIDVLVVDLETDVRGLLRAAQLRQTMINPPT